MFDKETLKYILKVIFSTFIAAMNGICAITSILDLIVIPVDNMLKVILNIVEIIWFTIFTIFWIIRTKYTIETGKFF